DIAVAIGLIALIAAKPGFGRPNLMKFLVFVIGGVIGFTLLRGMLVNPFLAFYSFRVRAVPLLFLFYVTFSRTRLEPVSSSQPWLVLWIGIALVVFCSRSVMGPTLFMAHDSPSYLFPFISGELRVVNNETILVFGLVLTMFLDNCLSTTNFETRRFYLFFLVALFVVIVLSRQRTATAASLAGLATLFLANYKFLRRNKVVLIILACLAFIAVVILSTGLLPVLLLMLPEQFQRSIEKFATLNARENVWNVAIGWRFVNWDIVRQLFGPPAGEPLDLVTSNGSLWGHSLHSQYIATIMNYGLVGAIAWAALVIYGIIQAFRALRSGQPNRVGLSPRVVLSWFAILLVFGIGYEWHDGAGFFMAMALAGWPSNKRRRKQKAPSARDDSLADSQAIVVGPG
ncbi:MAG: O-antigen ligase family protein, partial [Rhizomicrobium sp.]